jgi:hypothetical protein
MAHIVLTEEQMQVVSRAPDCVEVRDPQGRILTFLKPFAPGELEAIFRHLLQKGSNEPGIPSARVQAMLQRAHEIDEREGMTPKKMAELLRKVNKEEAI